MGTANTLDEEINHYLHRLSSRQKKTVLSVVKTFAEEDGEDLWEDKIFLEKSDHRTAEYESGKIKPLTLTELEDTARKLYKHRFSCRLANPKSCS